MRCHRMVGLLVAMFTAVIMAPPAAHAAPAPYPAEPPTASVSEGTVEPGGDVTFSGGGFLPYERISITVNFGSSDNAAAYRTESTGGFVLAAVKLARKLTLTTTADGDGNFSVSVPLSGTGTAMLVATGQTSGVKVSSTVEVAAAEGNGDNGDNENNGNESLPTTGPSSTPLLLSVGSGVSAVLLGVALLWTARGRRRDENM